ncbi:CofC, F420 2-Phospho-l-lactate Guanylyltransferase [Halorubrum sp. DM2]|uniref:2-phospho-L-lactate guanylyltransferase n=1 Tax=Halorubrum sp. DM2 TaxID=2527867 RepID=UPI0024B6B18C|nr:2-phospho-L-lactate guanylyltransferase [Halorubrum sp. DM2]VTT85917.1 CofC, F420 2-Phospho-l-lactate Guanylyltransferase [Halorubrum sp. DM2]
MEVIVPFSTDRPKSRLSDVLSPDERHAFARAMLEDVLDAVVAAGGDPRVLATDAVDVDRPVTVDDRPLTDAVNAALDARLGGEDGTESSGGPVAVVMADLALATPETIDRLFEAGRDADVAVAPGRGGGTNAFVASHPEFRVDYHGASYLDHREIAAEVGAAFVAVDSHRLATDVDEPDDLAEVLIHGEGRAATWLREAGVALDASGGRVTVARE